MEPIDLEEVEAIVEKLKDSSIDEANQARLRAVVEALKYLKELASEEGATDEDIRARFLERYAILFADSTDR